MIPDQLCPTDFVGEDITPTDDQHHSTISYHALAGGHSSMTLRFKGHIKGSPVQVLLDGGSDHNFVQPQVAKFLNMVVDEISPVMVGSGQRLRCSGVVKSVPLTVNGCDLCLDLYVLPFQGFDIVLGVSWLSTLGPVLTNYATRIFEFDY